MNRELKFRAWNKEFQRWIKPRFDGDILVGDHSVVAKHWKPYNGYYIIDNYETLDGDNVVVMQYTGLKDKNGKEVYEGDIVRCSYFKKSVGNHFGVIEIDAELTGIMLIDNLSLCVSNIIGKKWEDYTGYRAGEGSCKYMYLHNVYENSLDAEMSIEVIGNIYKNPELLEGK